MEKRAFRRIAHLSNRGLELPIDETVHHREHDEHHGGHAHAGDVHPRHPWGARDHAHKGAHRPIEVLTGDEVRRLVGAYSAKAPTGVRNRALIAVMYRGGLRISEALSLAVKDVDPDAGVVTVLFGKGGKRRTVALDAFAMGLVSLWIERRRDVARRRAWLLDGRRPLFCTLDGRPMYPNQLRRSMKLAAERAGIDKRVHPHGLRHTMAFELSMEGVSLNVIQRQLGHTNIATTDRYIGHIAPREVIAAIHSRPDWTAQAPPERTPAAA